MLALVLFDTGRGHYLHLCCAEVCSNKNENTIAFSVLHAWMAQVKSFLELKTWTFLSYILNNMVADDLVTVRHHKNVRWNLFINNIINYAMLRNMYDQWIMSSSRWVMAMTSSLVVRLEFPPHIFLRFLPWIVCKVFQSLTNINMKSYYTFIVIL